MYYSNGKKTVKIDNFVHAKAFENAGWKIIDNPQTKKQVKKSKENDLLNDIDE